MAVKSYKPTTPSRRGMTTVAGGVLTRTKSPKSLLVPKNRISGRNNQGKITIRHRGGGAKRFMRLVDFKFGAGRGGEVVAIEYDPNRSAYLARIKDGEGQQSYVLAGNRMKVGDKLTSSAEPEIRRGNRSSLKHIPVGTPVYNIELTPGAGGQLVRSAGARAQLMAKEGGMAQVKLPSGEVRIVREECLATIGSVGNESHQNIKLGSAGRVRRMGRRPVVRGKAMNPVDHPHGGGEGGTDIGLPSPKTPWGKPALGLKTRKRKLSDRSIVRSRKLGRRR